MGIDLYIFCKLIIIFFIFSCAGWLIEVIFKYFQYHRFINRGYLIGPYCPIYGGGVVAVTILVQITLQGEGSYAEVFLLGMVICGILEYFVSWYMERMYHARWWDYSNKPMNLNGRIWIGNLILFGIGSVVVIKWVNPALFSLMNNYPERVIVMLAAVIIILLTADNIFSNLLMSIVRKEIDAREEDNTEEISQKVHELLQDKNVLIRRINEAYPNLQARPEYLTQQLKEAQKEVKAATKALKAEIKVSSNNVKREIKMFQYTKKQYMSDVHQMKVENKDIRLNHTKEQLAKAKEHLREVREKLLYH